MKFGVITFPGSNCDEDMIYVLEEIMNQEVVNLWHKDTDIQNVDVVVVPGGFSYGDALRSGAIARFSPIMEQVIEHVKDIKDFYTHLINYGVVILGLFILNYFTNPEYIWAWWVAMGWGIGVLSHGLSVFEVYSFFGADWEKKQIEKRLGKKL